MTEKVLDDFIEYIITKHGEENWVSLYKEITMDDKSEDGVFYCALAPSDQIAAAMQQPSWDLFLGSGGPGFSTTYDGGKQIVTYHKNIDNNFQRLVIYRDFYGRKECYLEVAEEFRLLHNLYHDVNRSIYLTFDESGDEIEVIKMNQKEIQVRKSYLHSFMAATQMNLLLYFEITKHFNSSDRISNDHISENLCYTRYSGDSYVDGYATFTRVLGKKLSPCGTVECCGVWPYGKEKEYENFIIGGDTDAPVRFSCNPKMLANYFGANPESPHYLTPVFFKKEVMLKYYGSSEYEIQDGHLSRHGAWSLRFDNDSSNHISVFLGDLGRDLPSKEQTYWRSFNLIPDGRKISETNFQRSFLGNFFTPTSPELQFKSAFQKLQEEWHKFFWWHLFLPLIEKDKHFYHSIRSMLTNEQSEFDSQVLALAKVTIDSANVKELRCHLGTTNLDDPSITLLGMLFKKIGLDDAENKLAFFRCLQQIRSAGVVHRKGDKYDKIISKLNFNDGNYKEIFDEILSEFASVFTEIKCRIRV